MFHFYHYLETPASKNKKESTHVACMVRAKKGGYGTGQKGQR